jgi:hypothetical protein
MPVIAAVGQQKMSLNRDELASVDVDRPVGTMLLLRRFGTEEVYMIAEKLCVSICYRKDYAY